MERFLEESGINVQQVRWGYRQMGAYVEVGETRNEWDCGKIVEARSYAKKGAQRDMINARRMIQTGGEGGGVAAGVLAGMYLERAKRARKGFKGGRGGLAWFEML